MLPGHPAQSKYAVVPWIKIPCVDAHSPVVSPTIRRPGLRADLNRDLSVRCSGSPITRATLTPRRMAAVRDLPDQSPFAEKKNVPGWTPDLKSRTLELYESKKRCSPRNVLSQLYVQDELAAHSCFDAHCLRCVAGH